MLTTLAMCGSGGGGTSRDPISEAGNQQSGLRKGTRRAGAAPAAAAVTAVCGSNRCPCHWPDRSAAPPAAGAGCSFWPCPLPASLPGAGSGGSQASRPAGPRCLAESPRQPGCLGRGKIPGPFVIAAQPHAGARGGETRPTGEAQVPGTLLLREEEGQRESGRGGGVAFSKGAPCREQPGEGPETSGGQAGPRAASRRVGARELGQEGVHCRPAGQAGKDDSRDAASKGAPVRHTRTDT